MKISKIYDIRIIKDFLRTDHNFSYVRLWEQEENVKNFWTKLGGAIPETHKLYLAGNDEIMTEFILTYPYSNCVIIKEVNQ